MRPFFLAVFGWMTATALIAIPPGIAQAEPAYDAPPPAASGAPARPVEAADEAVPPGRSTPVAPARRRQEDESGPLSTLSEMPEETESDMRAAAVSGDDAAQNAGRNAAQASWSQLSVAQKEAALTAARQELHDQELHGQEAKSTESRGKAAKRPSREEAAFAAAQKRIRKLPPEKREAARQELEASLARIAPASLPVARSVPVVKPVISANIADNRCRTRRAIAGCR